MADTVQKQQHFDVIVYITQPLQLFIIFHPLRVVLDIIRSIHSKFQGRTPKKISHVQSVQKYWKRPLCPQDAQEKLHPRRRHALLSTDSVSML